MLYDEDEVTRLIVVVKFHIFFLIPLFIDSINRLSFKAPFVCFDQIHGESIRRQHVLQEKAQKLLQIQSAVWQKTDKLFQSTRCMVAFLSNSQF